MKLHTTPLAGLLVIEPQRHADARGWFMEGYNRQALAEAMAAGGHGEAPVFVQDNLSSSHAGVLRGLHHQLPPAAQGRLVQVIAGRAFDVVVDLRRQSPTFGRWYGLELSGDHALQLWIPPGFAHGFLSLSDGTTIAYKATAHHEPALERCIRWDDPDLAIPWPLAPGQRPRTSARDAAASSWSEADIGAYPDADRS